MILPGHLEVKRLLLAAAAEYRLDPAVCDEMTKFLFVQRLYTQQTSFENPEQENVALQVRYS
jgi:hypothetical protein